MFRRHKRRHTNIVFVIFRLLLSLLIFAALLAGVFSAYKHFSGVDALKLDPKAVVLGIMSSNKDIIKIVNKIPGIKGKWLASRSHAEGGRSEEVGSGKLEKDVGGEKSNFPPQNLTSQLPSPTSKLVFKFALFTDSHSDNVSLKKALDQMKKEHKDVKFIIGLGDYTDVGTLDELKRAKIELDSIGFRYFVIPGDHDLWESRNKSQTPTANYNQIFGHTFQTFDFENFKFIIIYNSDNYVGLGDGQKSWLAGELESSTKPKGTFVFLHEPLFHPSSDHFMGRVEEKLKVEAKDLIRQLSKAGVKKLFSGDTHFFSEFEEPETRLPMVTVGAITSVRNLQNPRFAIVSVYEDGSTRVEDVEVK